MKSLRLKSAYALKSIFCVLTILFLHVQLVVAAEVKPEQAIQVASRFLDKLNNTNARFIDSELTLVYVKSLPALSNGRQEPQALYYIFNKGDQGFVMVSGDDAAYPILAYSDESSFSEHQLPDAFVKWSARYEKQIRDIILSGKAATARINHAWEELTLEVESGVAPLMTTKWDQSPYFNDLCPFDPQYGQRSVVGCVATAMAQIMKYHNYPARGSGFHAYNHRSFGTISADFGLAEYQWDQMPDVVNSPNEAVALLSFHAGVSVEMHYSGSSSGAAGAVIVQPAMKQYFQYDAEIAHRNHFTQQQWVSLLMSELNAGRPIYYEGLGNGTGHAFVCDGYQNEDFFHFNWGWGGMMDGYYYINDLSPSELGTGGGNGSYNNDQAIVYGIKPAHGGGQNPNEPGEPESFDMQLYSDIQIDPNPILFANPFTVNVLVANYGMANFSGTLAAVITNRDNITEILDTIAVPEFTAQTYYELTFDSEGLAVATPGTYALAVFYKEMDGDWLLVESDTYEQVAEVEILGSDNPMTLSYPIELNKTQVTQGEPFGLQFNVVNQGEAEFSGKLYAALYDLDGNYRDVIDSLEVPSLAGGYTFVNNINMQSPGIWVAPGTYLLALIGSDADGTLLLAGGEYSNPVTVIVQEPPITADAYEDNDTETKAFQLTLGEFVNDQLIVKTTDANQHNELDYDYFLLDLPAGAEYTINARVHDSYDSQDGNTYTNDIVFSYKTSSGDWSEAYDISMDQVLELQDGGKVIFWVAPYFAGQVGTYALDIQISRIQEPQLTLVLNTPTAGSSLKPGVQQMIQWQSNVDGTLMLDLYRGQQFVSHIAQQIQNTGSYPWLVSDTLSAADDYKVVIFSSDDHQLSAQSAFFRIESVTGIDDEVARHIKIFPNPAEHELTLDFVNQKAVKVFLYNAQGIQQDNFEVDNFNVQIDLNQYTRGLYMLVMEWPDGQKSSHKFLKQ